MARTQCSECDEEIEIPGRPRLGQKLICNHCGAQLEVIATEPLEVEIAQDDEDDLWDNEDELEEDDLDDDDLELEELETDDLDEDDLDELEHDLEIDDEFDDDDFEDDDDDFEEDDDLYDDDDRWS